MKTDMLMNLIDMLVDRAGDHIDEGNSAKAKEYVAQLADMLKSAVTHIDNLENSN